MNRVSALGAIAAILFLIASASQADTLIATSGKERIPLVELYSSESCSSCPPADLWVSTLKDQAGLWKKFVPVVFHVDYWNKLGWKDGFSSDEMTKRQVAVSQTWSEPSVYTPAVVVDGKEWKNWRSDGAFPRSPSRQIELAIYKSDSGTIRVTASGLSDNKRYVVRLAKLGMDLGTDVKAGENAGRHLKHNFIVLGWEGKSISKTSSEQSFTLKETKQDGTRHAIAAWIEEQGSPAPLQSVGGYL